MAGLGRLASTDVKKRTERVRVKLMSIFVSEEIEERKRETGVNTKGV